MEPKGKGMEHPGGERAARVERLTEMPMLLLALAFVPASIIGNLPSLYAESHVNAAKFVEYAIVAAFAAGDSRNGGRGEDEGKGGQGTYVVSAEMPLVCNPPWEVPLTLQERACEPRRSFGRLGLGQRHLRRRRLPRGSKATLCAVDGSTSEDVREQLRHVPADATHLIVSAGGNDALGSSDFLGAPARSTAEALTRLADIADGFESRYYGMLAGVLAHGLPWAIRTVYYPRFPDAALQKIAVTGLAVFNDCIVRAADRPPPTESLKPTVAEAGRFHPENRGCLPYRCSYLPAALGLVGSSGSALALVDAEVNALNGNDPCIQANGVAVNGDGTDNGCDQSNGSDGGYKDGGYDRGDYRHQ